MFCNAEEQGPQETSPLETTFDLEDLEEQGLQETSPLETTFDLEDLEETGPQETFPSETTFDFEDLDTSSQSQVLETAFDIEPGPYGGLVSAMIDLHFLLPA